MARLNVIAAGVAGVFLACASGPASSEPLAEFYKGKQLEFIVGSAAGSTYDAWARVIGKHMAGQIPGKPVFVTKSMPGAGHIKATNHLFNIAPKDGTVIGMFSRNMPTRALLNHPAVKFKPAEFNWIGSPELTNRLCVAMSTAPVKTGDDLFEKEFVVGGAGAGGAVSTTPLILNAALGMKFKLVEGYKGTSDIFIAMERGEVQGICHSLSGLRAAVPGWLEAGKIRILFNMERKPIEGFSAPTIYKYIKTKEQRELVSFYTSNTELGRPIAAPPGLPGDRLNALRRAFDATMKDPGFKADAARQNLEINALTGEELSERILDLARTPVSVVDKTEALLAATPKQ